MDIKLKKMYLRSGIFEKWHTKKLENYTGSSKVIKDYLKEYVDEDRREGLVFRGINGIGKTMLMNVILMDKIAKGYKVHVVPYWLLVNEYIKSWRGESNYNTMLKCDYLGINDFGKSFEATENSKELAKSAIEFLVDYRIQRDKPILLTTNLKIVQFREVYGDDIASKLNEACTILDFQEKDKFKDDKRVEQRKIIKG